MIPDLGGQIDNLVQQLWECDVRYQESVREFKRRFITRVLTAHNGNQCAAAEALGMHRNTLARTIAELKIDFQHCKPGYQKPVRAHDAGMLDRYLEAERIAEHVRGNRVTA